MTWLAALFNRTSLLQLSLHSAIAAVLVAGWLLVAREVATDYALPVTFEIVATWLTLVCVLMTAKQNMWCWPTGVVSVLMFGWLFYEVQLYSSAVMNVVYYFPIQFYGWYQWMYGGEKKAEREPVWSSYQERLFTIIGVGTVFSAWAWYLVTYTDAVSVAPDAAIFALSFVAQWIMSYKRLESWLLWIAVDILSPIVYWQNGLYMIATLYAGFLGIAVYGFFSWWREARQNSNLMYGDRRMIGRL